MTFLSTSLVICLSLVVKYAISNKLYACLKSPDEDDIKTLDSFVAKLIEKAAK